MKVHRKPEDFDAIHIEKFDVKVIEEFCQPHNIFSTEYLGNEIQTMHIRTHTGPIYLHLGDWILKSKSGYIYIVPGELFDLRYEIDDTPGI